MAFPRSRRHTMLLMRFARRQTPIALTAEVDMAAVVAHRGRDLQGHRRAAFVSYVTYCAARALRDYPQANAALTGRLWPRQRLYTRVSAKVAVDMVDAERRFVASALVRDADQVDLAGLDQQIRRVAGLDVDHAGEFADLRRLWRAPWPVAMLAFAYIMAGAGRREEVLGTFSVSGLGHRCVTGFAPIGGTTVSLGVGRIREAVVVRDAQICIRPVLTLTLVFDHRMIDGALAADLLADIVGRLERWAEVTATGAQPTAAPVGAALSAAAAGHSAAGRSRR